MISSFMREKGFNKCKQSMIFKKSTMPEGYNLYNINGIFVSPIYTFPWRETSESTESSEMLEAMLKIIILS